MKHPEILTRAVIEPVYGVQRFLSAHERLSRALRRSAEDAQAFSSVSRAVRPVQPQKLQEQESVVRYIASFPVRKTLEEVRQGTVDLEDEEVGKVADRADTGGDEARGEARGRAGRQVGDEARDERFQVGEEGESGVKCGRRWLRQRRKAELNVRAARRGAHLVVEEQGGSLHAARFGARRGRRSRGEVECGFGLAFKLVKRLQGVVVFKHDLNEAIGARRGTASLDEPRATASVRVAVTLVSLGALETDPAAVLGSLEAEDGVAVLVGEGMQVGEEFAGGRKGVVGRWGGHLAALAKRSSVLSAAVTAQSRTSSISSMSLIKVEA